MQKCLGNRSLQKPHLSISNQLCFKRTCGENYSRFALKAGKFKRGAFTLSQFCLSELSVRGKTSKDIKKGK